MGAFKLKKDYKSVGYSTNEVNLHLQNLFFPYLLNNINNFASVLMLNISINKPKLFYLLLGIFVSVLILYKSFSSLLGENNKLPITLSV